MFFSHPYLSVSFPHEFHLWIQVTCFNMCSKNVSVYLFGSIFIKNLTRNSKKSCASCCSPISICTYYTISICCSSMVYHSMKKWKQKMRVLLAWCCSYQPIYCSNDALLGMMPTGTATWHRPNLRHKISAWHAQITLWTFTTVGQVLQSSIIQHFYKDSLDHEKMDNTAGITNIPLIPDAWW